MNDKLLQKLIQKLVREDLYSYNFEEGESLKFDPLQLWHIYDKLRNGRKLNSKERINYMKALSVATFDAVNYKSKPYKGSDKVSDEDLLEYLSTNVLKLRDYYQKDYSKIFNYHPKAPTSSAEIENFRKHIFNKACSLVSSSITYDKDKAMKDDGIDVERYKDDKKQAAKIGRADDINSKDYRQPGSIQTIKASFEEINKFIDSTFVYEEVFLDDVGEHFEPQPGVVSSMKSTQIEQIAKNFGLYDEPKMRKLFQYFDNDRVNEITPGKLWAIEFYLLDMTTLWKIYHSLQYGVALSKEGKEFILMQFLMIALSVYKDNQKGFSIDENTGEAFLNRDKMVLMTKVISDGYNYFYRNYKTTILSIKFSDEREAILSQVRSYFVQRINKILKEQNTKVALPMAKMLQLESISTGDITQLDISNTFQSEASFAGFLDNVRALIGKDEITADINLLKDAVKVMNMGQVKSALLTVLSASGYKLIPDSGEDNSFAVEGPKTAIHYELPTTDSNETCKFGVSIITGDCDGQQLKESIQFSRSQSADRSLIISTGEGFSDDFKKAKRTAPHLETWDLIDLVGMIQHTYEKMTEEEREKIDTVIEELILDF